MPAPQPLAARRSAALARPAPSACQRRLHLAAHAALIDTVTPGSPGAWSARHLNQLIESGLADWPPNADAGATTRFRMLGVSVTLPNPASPQAILNAWATAARDDLARTSGQLRTPA